MKTEHDETISGRSTADLQAKVEALRQSEERLRLMIDAVRDYAIFGLDPEGRITSWNTGAHRLKGYSRAEVLGHSFSMFYTDADRARRHPQEELRRAKAEGRYEEEGWRIRKDGSRFWANVVITAVFDHDGRHIGFTKVTRDFTERKHTEEKLRQSEERFRLLVDSVKDYAIFMLDPDGIITSWNKGAERIKGYRADEIIGKHFSIFYEDEARASRHPEYELKRAAAEGSYGEEGWRIRKDGTRFWANVLITAMRNPNGTLLGFAKVTRDLTERRDAYELLRRSEERLRLLIESVDDLAIYMLDTEGRIATWNSGAERIKGYRAEEVLGKHFSLFYRPEDAASGAPERELEVARRDGRHEEEGWRVRKNGELFCANVVLTAVYDDERTLRGFAKVTRDLTERRRMEEEARAAERAADEERARTFQAELAVKMRDDFISIAAHELRTPLAALKLKLQGAQRVLQKNDEKLHTTLAERLEGASRHVDRTGRLIERLLDVTRIVAGKFDVKREEMDLAATVHQVVTDYREHALQSGCEVRVEGAETVTGPWERQRIEQVVINLLTNAVKYGAGKPILVRVEEDGDIARLRVCDQGIGIAPSDVDRIFGRFERAVPANYGGLGLGLYITRHIIEAHGGTIQVESELGRGSEFVVALPRVREFVKVGAS
ncbi:MAG: PAS domain-containing sensor histidine kinase [Polyangiales bacterium]